jgi:hypothetical protein
MDTLLSALLTGFVSGSVLSSVIAIMFHGRTKKIEAIVQQRSRFEEKVLTDKYTLLLDISVRLERVMSNLYRWRVGQSVPEAFFAGTEDNARLTGKDVLPLSKICEDLQANKLLLGNGLFQLLWAQAQIAGAANNVAFDDAAAWEQKWNEWDNGREKISKAADESFGISLIRWQR